ncbi:hypothetical protein [Limosilactobacillus oris]|uniref:Uncharacterized protein n=1 Tax=Lactobacillus crispatus TaxID=47770 RepID=A0A921FI68_9LACO|nr:hypothetical protein [Limosilactobacillus oris]HJF10516.1 hypothetical protein [Lactobacillus crispatus]
MRTARNNLRLELENTLIDSLNDLASDAKRYDSGDVYAIKRSSITLRSIFYSKQNNPSIIKQLGLEDKLKLATYSKDYSNLDSIFSFNNLFFARFKQQNKLLVHQPFYDTLLFYPGKNQPYGYLSFSDWWNQPLIAFKDSSNGIDDSLPRKTLIIKEANQDGPAHFDERIDELYQKYRSGNNSFSFGVNGHPANPAIFEACIGGYTLDPTTIYKAVKPRDINLPLTRQVVHEVLISFNKTGKYRVNYSPDFKTLYNGKLNKATWNLMAK